MSTKELQAAFPSVTIGGHKCEGFVEGRLGPTMLPSVIVTVRRGSVAERELFEQFKKDTWEDFSFTLDGVAQESTGKIIACEHVAAGAQFTFSRRTK